MLIGRKPVLDAINEGRFIEKLFLLRTATGEEITILKKLAKEKNIPMSMVPAEKLDNFSRANHQGVIAIAGLVQYIDLQDAISFVTDKGKTPLFLLLDGITDIRNVGAIARTALCCGADGLILPVSHVASLNEEAIKTSAGALKKLLLCRVPSTVQAIDICRMNGIQMLGAVMKGNTEIRTVDFTLPSCIIMGAEDTGISKEALKFADHLTYIPMHGGFDSLNVSVAAGMMLYEAMNQRRDG